MQAGLLPFSRSLLVMDALCLAMLGVLPLLYYSVYLAKKKRAFSRHRRLQSLLSGLLLAVLLVFEWQVRTQDWLSYAQASPYYDRWVWPLLSLHLGIAVTTFVLWLVTLGLALQRFCQPLGPGKHSALHKKLGWGAVLGLSLTTLSGWLFYYAAFVA